MSENFSWSLKAKQDGRQFERSCVHTSSRFFENQPYEICSHFSEKASKGTFLKPDKHQNHSNEGKGKEQKKERGEGKKEKKKKQ